MTTLLVVGAREGSLGSFVYHEALMQGYETAWAGPTTEPLKLDLLQPKTVEAVVNSSRWDHVVCTAGVNTGDPLEEISVNYLGVLGLLDIWVKSWGYEESPKHKHFVAISSNSAHIARSRSVGYCSSKAALSMALRCRARLLADQRFAIYAYEPGWMIGTPMSKTIRSYVHNAPVHRIPGDNMIPPYELAAMIVHNLQFGGWLNGCTLRLDGGEQ